MADLKQKEMIFGLVEVIFGFGTIFTLGAAGFAIGGNWGISFAGLFGCSGALVPLLMRFSLRFFTGDGLPKVTEMMVMIWALVLYFVGGIVLIIARQDNKGVALSDNIYLPACFALITAIISTVDLILGLCGK